MAKARKTQIGQYLKAAREKANLTQLDLAKCLGYTNSQFISNWERGAGVPPPAKFEELSNILMVPSTKLVDLLLEEKRERIRSRMNP